MVCPFDAASSVWPLIAYFAYLLVFERDLMHNGDRQSDLFRAVGLNAMLLPINISGAIHSIGQLWTGRKIPFQRTPKVQERTAATPGHIAAQLGLLLLALVQVLVQYRAGHWITCLLFASYSAACGYALHALIGWKTVLEDGLGGLKLRLRNMLTPLLQKPRPQE
jgi:cellulose synthase (UDP-forming)